jgi:acyl dehydratase
LSLYLEDFELNVTHLTPSRTIGESDIAQFAELVGDFNPLHMDEEFSRNSIFGTRVAHGPLAASIATGLMTQLGWIDGTTLGLLDMSWKFHAPVRLDDTISAKVTPLEARPSKAAGRGVLKLGVEVLNQRDEVVQTGSVVLLMLRRPAQAS